MDQASAGLVAQSFGESLARLKGQSVSVLQYAETLDDGSVVLRFIDGSMLRANYWRLFKDRKSWLSSFDHRQKYGLPEVIDAIDQLRATLGTNLLEDAYLDVESGDLFFDFAPNLRFQAFNVTSYEIWEMSFPDGTVEYSNYA